MPRKGWAWVQTAPKQFKAKPSEEMKKEISEKCQALVEEFKKQFINPNPDKEWNYLVDIYTKWYQGYFYFCQKSIMETPGRTAKEFEEKFVRLTYKCPDRFDFAYFRHTGKWFPVAEDLSLQDCLEMMSQNPNFQPIG